MKLKRVLNCVSRILQSYVSGQTCLDIRGSRLTNQSKMLFLNCCVNYLIMLRDVYLFYYVHTRDTTWELRRESMYLSLENKDTTFLFSTLQIMLDMMAFLQYMYIIRLYGAHMYLSTNEPIYLNDLISHFIGFKNQVVIKQILINNSKQQ